MKIAKWFKYNSIIPFHILVLRRPFIPSADRPLNTGSKSYQQDFPDKRLIKLFIPDASVRAYMVEMSPSCGSSIFPSFHAGRERKEKWMIPMRETSLM